MKNIVFCADGTWNGPNDDEDKDGVPDITNVLKIFVNMQGDDTLHDRNKGNEQERVAVDAAGKPVQVAKYLHGVGDSSNRLVHLLGGMFGAGIITRIVRGYTFISRNYEPGDKIVLIGFSRGAYTARALGGMIASQGLLNPAANDLSDKELAYRLGTAAWHKYRHEAIKTKPHGLRAIFRAVIEDLPRFTSRKLGDKDLLPVADIHAIAVWDTVGSLGIPKYDGQDERVDTFRFTDESLSVKVVNAFHAVAVDELRKDFAPTLWNANGKTNVKQVLFPGAHADVGGGYSWAKQEAGLSDVALEWMRSELKKAGVLFVAKSPIPIVRDFAGYAHLPHASGIFAHIPPHPRNWPPHVEMHEAAHKRWHTAAVLAGGKPAPYRPQNLDQFMDGNGQLLPGVVPVPY